MISNVNRVNWGNIIARPIWPAQVYLPLDPLTSCIATYGDRRSMPHLPEDATIIKSRKDVIT